MADIQIPQLPPISDLQRATDDLFMVRDVDDNYDRQITHYQVLNPFKVEGNYNFSFTAMFSEGDYGLGGGPVDLQGVNIKGEYLNAGITTNLNSVVQTGTYLCKQGTNDNGPPNTIDNDFPTGSAYTLEHVEGLESVRYAHRGDKNSWMQVGSSNPYHEIAWREDHNSISEAKAIMNSVILDIMFPIGTVYQTTDPASTGPASSISLKTGVTTVWSLIKGRILVGQDTTNTSFDTVGEQGGALNHKHTITSNAAHNISVNGHAITTAQTPSHAHDAFGLTTSSAGTHNHTFSATTSSDGGHSHTDGTLKTVDNTGGHTHTGSSSSSLGQDRFDKQKNGGLCYTPFSGSTLSGSVTLAASSGKHNHDVTGSTSSTSSHNHSLGGSTSTASSHTHAINGSTDTTGNGQEHNHGISGDVSVTSSSNTISNLQPYQVVKIYTRVF